MNQQEKFLDLYCFERLNSWKNIADKEKSDIETVKNKYKSLNFYFAKHCNSTEDNIKEYFVSLKPEIDKINSVYQKYTKDRKIGFKGFKNFYNWFIMQYEKQKGKCYYCETTEDDLKLLFQKGVFNPKKPAWKNGTLQIEKKEPDKGYFSKNCVLACVLCNNAKSDLISDVDFENIFAEPMKKYLQEKISNLKK